MIQRSPRRLGRSVLALVGGFVLVVILSLVSDIALYRAAGVTGPGQALPSRFLAIALAYRVLYSIVGSYLTARLAPYEPMLHALIGGAIGLLIAAAGAVGTWHSSFTQGAHWYPVALVVAALPAAWLGGRLCVARMRAAQPV